MGKIIKKKRISKDRLKKKREKEKIKQNEYWNKFTRELNKEKPLTIWERIKLYFTNLIK